MHGGMKARSRVVVALMAVALVATACSKATAGGAGSFDATSVSCASASACFTVGNVSTIGGPVQGLFEGAQVGTDAYLSYINSLGGVDGKKFKLIEKDDVLSPNNNQQAVESLMAQHVDALVGSFSLEDSAGATVLSKNPTIPDVSMSLDPTTNALPNNFSPQPLGQGWNTGPLLYYAKHYPNAIQHVGSFIGSVAPSPAAFAGEEDVMNAMVNVGYRVVDAQQFSVVATEADFVSEVAGMQAKGVEAVDLTEMDVQEADQIIQAMATDNFKPQLIFSGGPLYNSSLIANAGSGASLLNGAQIGQEQAMYLPSDPTQPTVGSSPADDLFLKWVNKVQPGWDTNKLDLYTLYGWASAELYVEGVRAAGPNPTPSQVTNALANISSFDASGLMAPSNPAGKQPPSQWFLVTIQNGKYVAGEGDPATGFRTDTFGYYPKVPVFTR